jgi:benzylsuccinate CoA-transferase BbsF subunit
VAPRFGAVAVLAALEYHKRTGKGQYIDQSQAESALHFLAPALLDCALNGRMSQGLGNDDPNYAPHGVYPALGNDCWVAIACLSEEHWRRLCSVMARDDLVNSKSFATLPDRHHNRGELDQILAAWTSGLSAGDAEGLLQGAGVPAAAVKNSAAVCQDEQLASRGYLVELDHAACGKTVIEGSRFVLSRTPASISRPAPIIGGDNQYVLQSILGYDERRINELLAAGALE